MEPSPTKPGSEREEISLVIEPIAIANCLAQPPAFYECATDYLVFEVDDEFESS